MTPEEMRLEFDAIKKRNARVEMDKAWEISLTRRIFIAALTYVVAVAWLVLIHETNFLLKACVPVVGYVLSTLSLPIIKDWWIKNKII